MDIVRSILMECAPNVLIDISSTNQYASLIPKDVSPIVGRTVLNAK
jgi:hypothetical protein